MLKYANILSELRLKTIFMFEGLQYENSIKFNFIFMIKLKNIFFSKYININFYRSQKIYFLIKDYYRYMLYEQYLIVIINKIYKEYNDNFKNILINKSVDDILVNYKLPKNINDKINFFFNNNWYNFLSNIIIILKTNIYLVNEFELLLLKYNFNKWNNIDSCKDLEEFIMKINLLLKKFNNK